MTPPRDHVDFRHGVLVALLLSLALAPHARGPSSEEADQGPRRVVTDDLGHEVVLDRPPGRIVSLAPSNTEILFALGVGDRVVAGTVHDDWPRRTRRLPRVGGYGEADLEAVLALRPDLVVAAGLQTGSSVASLRRLGLPTFVVQPASLEAMLDGIRRLGRLVGAHRAGDRLAARMSARIEGLRQAVAASPRPRVFLELSEDLFTVGPGSFLHDLVEAAGGENIAGDAGRRYPRLSAEVVIARDPEVILLADQGAGVDADDVAARPGWGAITAVRAGRVVEIDDVDVLARPGPRVVDGLGFLVRVLHGGS